MAFDKWIADAESVLSSCSRYHPGRPHLLHLLASEKLYRYNRYDTVAPQKSDLDDVIIFLAEALLFPFRIIDGNRLNSVGALYQLAYALVHRFEHTRQPSDLEHGINHFRHVLYLPFRNTDHHFSTISAQLATALSDKTRLHPSSEQGNIEEVLTLYLSCRPWDPTEKDTAAVLARLALAVAFRLQWTGKSERFEEVVRYLREGCRLCQSKDLLALSVLLAFILSWHWHCTGMTNDFHEIMTLFNENLPLLPTGHYLQPLAQVSMWHLTNSQSIGSDTSDRVVEAINMCRALLNTLPAGPQYRPMPLYILARLLRQRYEHFGNEECLKEAELCTEEAFSLSQSEEFQSLCHTGNGPTSTMLPIINADSSMAGLEEEIRHSDERLAVAKPGDGGYIDAVLNSHILYMIKFDHSNNLADLEDVTKSRQILLSSAPNIFEVVDLALDLQLAYMLSGHEELLHKSIEICRNVLESQSQQTSRFKVFRILCTSLGLLFFKYGHLENLNESVAIFQAAFEEDGSDASDRLYIAWLWVSVARYPNHPSTLAAYQGAMSAIHDSLIVGPTVQAQHTIMGNIGSYMRIPLEYASYQIERGQLEPAIEVLEEGRALLWSEMRGLRSSTDQLRKIDPTLADKFLTLSKALEAVTTTTSRSLQPQKDTIPLLDLAAGHEEIDAFNQMLKEQRRLLQERRAIISQIRTTPGFEHFLKAVPFHRLRNAASRGPIIIINHCLWRCDIVIVLRDAPPSPIPTTRQFYKRAITLESKLLDARKKHTLESKQYNRVLRSVLEELYELVGRPVIDRLRELHIPMHSRIWWCPTSVFCSLPLHAMGPILSDDNQKLYFSDLYVCSYTPTLGALIASRTAVAQMSDPSPSLLMVGQPDAYLRGVKGELEVIRAVGIPVTGLVSEQATRATVLQGLQKHRLVHFACHGTLEPGKPFDAAFELYGGDRLTLLDIVRSQLPVAEFAFLSACHTAELTDVANPDECLHLAAAMQYAGFHSVVGTMWAMADTDGRDLSAHFYRLMLSPDGDGDGDGSKSLCGRSARALRGAVQQLRNKKGITLERWVNFVHYGA